MAKSNNGISKHTKRLEEYRQIDNRQNNQNLLSISLSYIISNKIQNKTRNTKKIDEHITDDTIKVYYLSVYHLLSLTKLKT